MGILGGLAARGEPHSRVWEILGVERPATSWAGDGLYPDSLPVLRRLRASGVVVGAVGNTPVEAEELVREHVDFVGSSARWGVQKPVPEFFARVAEEAGYPPPEIAYVGDRVDNDVAPAHAAGMVAVFLRRGPWAWTHAPREDPPGADLVVDTLAELPLRLRRSPFARTGS
jgi:HAD superfamily hydrolase (TIGR01509 family)